MLRGIHKLCDKGLWEEAQTLLNDSGSEGKSAREALSQPGGYGEWTALHLACKHNPPVQIVQILCDFSPVSIETFDLYTKLPLHYAVEAGASTKVIKALVNACPESITGIDANCCTPLHLSMKASTRDASLSDEQVRPFPKVDEIKLLLDQEGAVIWTADDNGYIPLHYAACNLHKCDISALRKLIDVDVKSIVAQDDEGMTALHLALLKSTEIPISVNHVEALLGISTDNKEMVGEEYDVSTMLDHKDRLPIHCACHNFELIPVEVFQLLLERCPSGASTACNDGGFPLEIIESSRSQILDPEELEDFNQKSDLMFAYHTDLEHFCTDDRLQRIATRIVDELTVKQDELSEVSLSLWIWMCTFPDIDDPAMKYPKTVRSILDSLPDHQSKKFLASIETLTEEGKSVPLKELASNSCREVLLPYLRFIDRYELMTGPANIVRTRSFITIRALDTYEYDTKFWDTVQIKLFFDKQEFQQESIVHNAIKSSMTSNQPQPVCPMVEDFDLDRIGTAEESPQDLDFSRDLLQIDDPVVQSMRQAIIYGEPTIMEQNFRENEMRSQTEIKKHLLSIAECYCNFHENGMSVGQVNIQDFLKWVEKRTVLQNIDSISMTQDNAVCSKTEFYGDISSIRAAWYLPPEMVAKLNKEEIEKFTIYWESVANDAHIMKELTDEGFETNSDRLKNYIEMDGSTPESFRARINYNSKMWETIKPRQIGQDYFVIKCFDCDSIGDPLTSGDLPYDLIRMNNALDVWYFGCILFEVLAGETLFHADNMGNIVDDNVFRTLYEFDLHAQNDLISKRIQKVNDPLGRDLLRSLLMREPSQRQPNMISVTEHPFFCEDESKVNSFIREIVDEELAVENERLMMEENQMKEKKMKEELFQRTHVVEHLSSKLNLLFENAMWKKLSPEYQIEDATFPTSSVLLPYRLINKNGYLTVTTNMKDVATKVGLLVNNILFYSYIASEIEKNWIESSDEPQSNKLIMAPQNCESFSTNGKNAVDTCSDILEMKKVVTAALEESLCCYVTPDIAKECAGTLVKDALESYINIDLCEELVDKTIYTEQKISSLVDKFMVNNSLSTSNDIVSSKIVEIFGSEFCNESTKSFEKIKSSLATLLNDFSEDCFNSITQMVGFYVDELVNLYQSTGSSFLYMLDEVTGQLIYSEQYPLHFNFSQDILSTLIPLSILSLSAKYPDDLAAALGLDEDNFPSEWHQMKLSHYDVYKSDESCDKYFNYIQEVSASQRVCIEDDTTETKMTTRQDLLKRFKQILDQHDPEKDFAGLLRLSSGNGKILWTTQVGQVTAAEEARLELEDIRNSSKDRSRFEKLPSRKMPKEDSTEEMNQLWNNFIKFSHEEQKLDFQYISVQESSNVRTLCSFGGTRISAKMKGWKPVIINEKKSMQSSLQPKTEIIHDHKNTPDKVSTLIPIDEPISQDKVKTSNLRMTGQEDNCRHTCDNDDYLKPHELDCKTPRIRHSQSLQNQTIAGSDIPKRTGSIDGNKYNGTISNYSRTENNIIPPNQREIPGVGLRPSQNELDEDDRSLVSSTSISTMRSKTPAPRSAKKTLSSIRKIGGENTRNASILVETRPSLNASPLRPKGTRPERINNLANQMTNVPSGKKLSSRRVSKGGLRAASPMRRRNPRNSQDFSDSISIRSSEENAFQPF